MSPQPAKPKKPDPKLREDYRLAILFLFDGPSIQCLARIDKSGMWVHTATESVAASYPTHRVADIVWPPSEEGTGEPDEGGEA